MTGMNEALAAALEIDGAIGAAIANWDSGLCLGTAGGGSRLNIDAAAAGSCQVVKARMLTAVESGATSPIQEILITLDEQVHLIRPLRRGERLFLFLAIDTATGNLGVARHRLNTLESDLLM